MIVSLHPVFPAPPQAFVRRRRARRGMALLLVMIGMVVCTILTAGFLSTQGTSLGIARNERDAQKCRVIAQTGVDMCYWLIRNRADWRQSMAPGKWLNSFPVGDGTVTVKVVDGDGTGNFLDDPTQGVTLTSTGSYGGHEFALTATIQPTGGGTVFNNGNFVGGRIILGNSDRIFPAVLDSYNSSVSAYNVLTAGSNATFTSTSASADTLTVYSPSAFRGGFFANPGVLVPLTTILLDGLFASGPTSTATAVELRSPGSVVTPNVTGLPAQGNGNFSAINYPVPGRYDNFTVGNTQVYPSTGVYHITGNFSLNNATSILNVTDKHPVFIIDNDATFKGRIIISGGGSATFYCNKTVTIEGATLNSGGPPKRLLILGTNNCTTVNISGSTTAMYSALFSPAANVTLHTGSPKFYGAVVAKSLTIRNTAQFHFDEALRSLQLTNITGGSAAPGTAEYRVTVSSGPGLVK